MPLHVELREPRTEVEFETYYRLRFERLRKPHGQPPGSERDHPLEAASEHVVALAGDRVVGGLAWVMHRGSTVNNETGQLVCRLRQIAVDAEFEGQGVGGKLCEYLEARCVEQGVEHIVSNIRLENVPWFNRLGFLDLGPGATLFGEVQHRSMIKVLRRKSDDASESH
jgi:N-acetylglutamate synthase-like GNAT family acetyltransferase